MDWSFFESLDEEQAGEFLKHFLRIESAGFNALSGHLAEEKVPAEFSVNSAEPVMLWVLARLKTRPAPPDPNLPEWILNSSSYLRGFYEFDRDSKIIILRASFYLGECFARTYPHLQWATGDRNTAVQNMPVLKNPRSRVELAPLLILENILSRISEDPAKKDDVRNMLEYWKQWAES
jgi:hypothetical protein